MAEQILQQIDKYKIIAILRNVPLSQVLDVADALLKGGIRMLELTFNHDSENKIEETLEAIERLAQNYEDELLIGAGTVLTAAEVIAAKKAGAKYIISPNVNPDVIRTAKSEGLVSMPGAFTPTEVSLAYDLGADIIKLFPVDGLGRAYVKALKGPLNHVPMAVVGGVNETNIREFLECGACCFGIGGNLVRQDYIQNGQFAKITEIAEKLVTALEG